MQTHLPPMGMVIWVYDSNSFAFDDDNNYNNNIVCHSKFSQQFVIIRANIPLKNTT